MSTTNLSLYNIETELLDLLRWREELIENREMTPEEMNATLRACDDQIREYVTREVQKADGIAAYLRECESRVATLKAEAKRVKELADVWQTRHDRLEDLTRGIMQQIGKKVIEGARSTLKLAKNPVSVEVAQPDLVPSPYQRVEVKLTLDLWTRITARVMTTEKKGDEMLAEVLDTKVSAPEPILSRIKEELKAGVGVPGCRLANENFRLEIK
jgi:transcriptional regulator